MLKESTCSWHTLEQMSLQQTSQYGIPHRTAQSLQIIASAYFPFILQLDCLVPEFVDLARAEHLVPGSKRTPGS